MCYLPARKHRLPTIIVTASLMSRLGLVESLMARGMSLVCFDFAGCGHSEGEYISLGYY